MIRVLTLIFYFTSFSFAGYYLYDPACKTGGTCSIWHNSCAASTWFSTSDAASFASCNSGFKVVWTTLPNATSYCDYRAISENIAKYECEACPSTASVQSQVDAANAQCAADGGDPQNTLGTSPAGCPVLSGGCDMCTKYKNDASDACAESMGLAENCYFEDGYVDGYCSFDANGNISEPHYVCKTGLPICETPSSSSAGTGTSSDDGTSSGDGGSSSSGDSGASSESNGSSSSDSPGSSGAGGSSGSDGSSAGSSSPSGSSGSANSSASSSPSGGGGDTTIVDLGPVLSAIGTMHGDMIFNFGRVFSELGIMSATLQTAISTAEGNILSSVAGAKSAILADNQDTRDQMTAQEVVNNEQHDTTQARLGELMESVDTIAGRVYSYYQGTTNQIKGLARSIDTLNGMLEGMEEQDGLYYDSSLANSDYTNRRLDSLQWKLENGLNDVVGAIEGLGLDSNGSTDSGDYSGVGDDAFGVDDTTVVGSAFYEAQLGSGNGYGQAYLDSSEKFANEIRTATATPFSDSKAVCPATMKVDMCTYFGSSCVIDFCDTRFHFGGQHVLYWFGMLIELLAWIAFFRGIR